MASTLRGHDGVVSTLEGQDCSFCEDGQLVEGTYRGGPAVVCRACEVPQVRFF